MVVADYARGERVNIVQSAATELAAVHRNTARMTSQLIVVWSRMPFTASVHSWIRRPIALQHSNCELDRNTYFACEWPPNDLFVRCVIGIYSFAGSSMALFTVAARSKQTNGVSMIEFRSIESCFVAGCWGASSNGRLESEQ